jgi:hypothetical protein
VRLDCLLSHPTAFSLLPSLAITLLPSLPGADEVAIVEQRTWMSVKEIGYGLYDANYRLLSVYSRRFQDVCMVGLLSSYLGRAELICILLSSAIDLF